MEHGNSLTFNRKISLIHGIGQEVIKWRKKVECLRFTKAQEVCVFCVIILIS